ncbi:helix-turn-helix transcriptional regulator [Rhizobium leguminosarum]|uniref:helix-turn-helix transcriptional regulator n=1 Tax=Rhizobium leguminosarum TaxID=384 RepID=UPI00298C8498|nr:helix-turn-helix domain-containing protein [Rhizobium leguminosarum]
MSLRERVARNLRRVRHEKSMSQEELAHRAHINRNYVGMLEREEYAASRTCSKSSLLPLELIRSNSSATRLDEGSVISRNRRKLPSDITPIASLLESRRYETLVAVDGLDLE